MNKIKKGDLSRPFHQTDQRWLLGVTFTGTQPWPGLVVGGRGLLSGTAAKLGFLPPCGPTSWKMPPWLPVFEPGFLGAVIGFSLETAKHPGHSKPQLSA